MGAAHSETKRNNLDLDLSDLGQPDSLRYNILTFVINEEYDRAINYLKDFMDVESEYPNFKLRIERYVQHSIDLIFAIRTKRNFPGMNQLTRTKQQELKEKFKEHFQELKMIIKKIENSQEELRLTDIKSTKIVVQSLWLASVVVFCSAVGIEIARGLGMTVGIVMDEYLTLAIDWVFKAVGLF